MPAERQSGVVTHTGIWLPGGTILHLGFKRFCFFLNLFIIYFIYLFWLHRVLVVARRIFSCGMWDLVPRPGIEPAAPALGARSLTHWTTREVPRL